MSVRIMKAIDGIPLPTELPVKECHKVIGMATHFRTEGDFVVCDIDEQVAKHAKFSTTRTEVRILELQRLIKFNT